MRTNTYDAAAQSRNAIGRSRRGIRAASRLLYRRVRERPQRICNPAGRADQPAKQHATGGVLLVDAHGLRAHERPGTNVTYTNNWPHEPLIGNVPTPAQRSCGACVSFVLLACRASAAWSGGTRRRRRNRCTRAFPASDPFLGFTPTPSQRATFKYFFVVVSALGRADSDGRHHRALRSGRRRLLRHPARQVSCPTPSRAPGTCRSRIFWIATSWLATGLYIGPAVSGHEPKYQRLGVNVLFGALILVVGGSLAGEWLGIQQKLGNLLVLVRQPGLRVRRPRPRLADSAVRRIGALAVS